MQHALALARKGAGLASPNPMVGCVIVREGQIVGEGFHQYDWRDHAEIVALRSAGEKSRGATLYVNLEPCCHTGRTGPCTEAIIAARPARVVVGCRDPNPRVDGRGVARLRRAGIRVDVGVLDAECRATNRAFFVWVREGRAPVWITGPTARLAAHELRAAHDAVLVGAGTVLADDPRLTVRLPRSAGKRPGGGRSAPVRVVLDGRLRTPPAARVLGRGA